MLEPITWQKGERSQQVGRLVHYSDRLPDVFRARMKQLEAIHRWLGGYFQAVGIMLQIPGAGEYESSCEDEEWDMDFVWRADRDMLVSILAEALERLDAGALIQQVPGVGAYQPRDLPVDLRIALAEFGRNELLNVVAGCLDRFMVIPELGEEERSLYETLEPRPGAWRRCWRASIKHLRRFLWGRGSSTR